MHKITSRLTMAALCGLVAPMVLQACSGNQPAAEAPETEVETTETVSADGAAMGKGTLEFRANGEDFVRQGFTTKDGWEVSFDNVFVSLADVTAYQTDPPFDAEAGTKMDAKEQVSVGEPVVVDLAEGDENAETILVSEVEAPAGRYNALAWQMVPATSGPAEGYSVLMQGTATKDGETLPFTIGISEELAFTCGDFVGDARKGILDDGAMADIESTFHFDHLFGDAGAPIDDDINTGALGFDPLAAMAEGGTVNVDSASLKENLSEEDYATFMNILPSLGHVGEGHCEETNLTT
jgi:hypothetical protein